MAENKSKYDPRDIEKIMKDDYQLKRFFERSDNEEAALNWVLEVLEWKKEHATERFNKDEDYPTEFYEIGHYELLGRDTDNALVMWNSSKYTREFKDLKEKVEEFTIHELEYLDDLAGESGIYMIIDASHSSLFNIDMELNEFTCKTMDTYYPGIVKRTVVVNLPWLIFPLAKIMMSLTSTEVQAATKIITVDELDKYLDKKFIPDKYGGSLKRSERKIRFPKNVAKMQSFFTIYKNKYTEKEMEKYKKILAKINEEYEEDTIIEKKVEKTKSQKSESEKSGSQKTKPTKD